jgi:hypothetical protein
VLAVAAVAAGARAARAGDAARAVERGAWLEVARGDAAGAEAAYREALAAAGARDAARAEALFRLAALCARAGRAEEARGPLEELARAFPERRDFAARVEALLAPVTATATAGAGAGAADAPPRPSAAARADAPARAAAASPAPPTATAEVLVLACDATAFAALPFAFEPLAPGRPAPDPGVAGRAALLSPTEARALLARLRAPGGPAATRPRTVALRPDAAAPLVFREPPLADPLRVSLRALPDARGAPDLEIDADLAGARLRGRAAPTRARPAVLAAGLRDPRSGARVLILIVPGD